MGTNFQPDKLTVRSAEILPSVVTTNILAEDIAQVLREDTDEPHTGQQQQQQQQQQQKTCPDAADATTAPLSKLRDAVGAIEPLSALKVYGVYGSVYMAMFVDHRLDVARLAREPHRGFLTVLETYMQVPKRLFTWAPTCVVISFAGGYLYSRWFSNMLATHYALRAQKKAEQLEKERRWR